MCWTRGSKYIVLVFPSHAQGVYSIRIIFEVLGGINFKETLKFEKPFFRALFRNLPLPNERTAGTFNMPTSYQ